MTNIPKPQKKGSWVVMRWFDMINEVKDVNSILNK